MACLGWLLIFGLIAAVPTWVFGIKDGNVGFGVGVAFFTVVVLGFALWAERDRG